MLKGGAQIRHQIQNRAPGIVGPSTTLLSWRHQIALVMGWRRLRLWGGRVLLRRSPRDGRSWKISKLRRMVNPAFGGFYLNVVTSALHEVPGLSERKLGRLAVGGGDASDVSCAYSVGHLISSFCASFSALQLGLETLWPSWTSARRQRCQPTLGQPTGLSLPVFSEPWWFCSSPSTARRLGRSNSQASACLFCSSSVLII